MKTVTIDFISLRDANHDPSADLAFANTVFAPCCVNFAALTGQTPTAALSDSWLGGDTVMDRSTGSCANGGATAEEIAAYEGAERAFGLSGRVRVFYVEAANPPERGRSVPPSCSVGKATAIPNMLMVTNKADVRTLAHELGHILLDPGTHSVPEDNLMRPSLEAKGNNLTAEQCATIFFNANA